MQDTVNFKSIAGICKIQAAIKKFNDRTCPGFRLRKSRLYSGDRGRISGSF